jgi:hypothetical protein
MAKAELSPSALTQTLSLALSVLLVVGYRFGLLCAANKVGPGHGI